jgi:uncharacterized protein YuzB (UPF0349 family)
LQPVQNGYRLVTPINEKLEMIFNPDFMEYYCLLTVCGEDANEHRAINESQWLVGEDANKSGRIGIGLSYICSAKN